MIIDSIWTSLLLRLNLMFLGVNAYSKVLQKFLIKLVQNFRKLNGLHGDHPQLREIFTSPARRFTVLLGYVKYLQKTYYSFMNFLHICIKTCNIGRCRSTIASCVSRVPVIGGRLRVAVSGVDCRIFSQNRWSSEKKVTLSPHLLSKQKNSSF